MAETDELRVVELVSDNGPGLLIPVVVIADGGLDPSAATAGGMPSRIDPEQLIAPVRALAEKISEGLLGSGPSKIVVECGITAALQNGKLTALLVEGKAEVALKLSIEWERKDKE